MKITSENISQKEREQGEIVALQFDHRGLIPVFVTEAETGIALMQAWMNQEAFALTVKSGEAHYWSRSRGEIWHKGATSGQIQTVQTLRTDCDQDSLWMTVKQAGGGCCHVGYSSCFYRDIIVNTDTNSLTHQQDPTHRQNPEDQEEISVKLSFVDAV